MIPEHFTLVNVTDTCAIWNVVGSATLFKAARKSGLYFIITNTVYYECFVKSKGTAPSAEHEELRIRLRENIHRGDVSRIDLTIDDLQELIGVARRLGVDRRLGYGEMASAALARHLGQAVLTDNKRDFRAIGELVDGRLQTTPRLLGWLYLDGGLTDGEVKDVIEQHRKSGGQMAEVYERAHYEACEKRLMQQAGTRART